MVEIKGKKIEAPVFFPDATRGVVRGVDFYDLNHVGVTGLVANTFHLLTQPGKEILKHGGGLKRYMHWDGWLISDSGGFQLLSLVHSKRIPGKITPEGIRFQKANGKKVMFTPEKSIQLQFAIDSDIMVCLDDCPTPAATPAQVQQSVDHTIAWAQRCKEAFEQQVEQKQLTDVERPLLFGVIQGEDHLDERKRCAEALAKIGLDGYGFGGWPLNPDKSLKTDVLQETANLMPDNLPKYALGVGNPQAIVDCVKMGYQIFDCVLPTRDARHKRLYVFRVDPKQVDLSTTANFYEHLHIMREKYVRDLRPISEYCDCFTCQNYSRAYLHHLFNIRDNLAKRLATIHNLRMYMMLMENLRQNVVHNSK